MSEEGESSGLGGSWTGPHPEPPPTSGLLGQAKKKEYIAYKLIVDPSLVKGAFKTYRFDGNLPDDPSYPQVVVRDPRNPRRKKIANMSLPVPYFKVDKNYIGQPPPVEVTITNVNDNIGKNFLKDIITKQGDEGFQDLTIFYHPLTNKHLGLAHVIFKRPCYAQTCVERLNNISFMGQKLSVFIDSVGDKCKQLFEELTSEPRKPDEKLSLEIKSASNNNHKDGVDKSPRLIKLTDSAKKPAILHETVNLNPSEFMSTTNLTNGVYTEGMGNHELYNAYRSSSKGLPGYNATMYQKPPSQNFTWGGQPDSFPGSNASPQVINRQYEAKGDEDDSKLSTDDTGSPKMDLDTRIKMLFSGNRSSDLGIRFSLEDVCSSDSEENLLPRKRPKLGIGSAELWGSDSGDGEDTVESAFAKKFKRNTFVPVSEDGSAKHRANSSPPPSPFLALSSIAERSDSLPLATLESLKEKLENELEKISDESNGISPGKRKGRKGDEMSLSSLSPEDPSYISLPPNPPPEPPFPPLPIEDPQVPPNYMPQYFPGYAPVPFQPYMVPWNVSQEYHQQQQPYYPPNYEMYPPTQEDKIQSLEYSEGEEEEDVMLNPMTISDLVIERIYEELKNILRKDCRKRVIENEAYKKYETWCEKREQYHKTMQMQKLEQENKSFSVPEPPLSTFHGFDFKGPDSVFGGSMSSMGLGIRCSIPKLPSFRIRKPREPSPEFVEDDSRKSSDSDIGGSSSESEDEDDRRAPRRPLRRLSLSSDASSSTSSESSFEDDDTDVESVSDDSVKQQSVTAHEARIKSDPLLGTESISEDSYSDDEFKSAIKKDTELVTKTAFDDDKQKSPIGVPYNETPSLDSLVSIKQEIDDLSVHEQSEDLLYPQKAFHLDDHNYCVSFDYKEADRIDRDVAIVPVKEEEVSKRSQRESHQKTPSKNSFSLRTAKQQEELVFDFYQLGLDTEELYFVKKAFEDSLLKDSGGYWINSAHWLDNASTSFPPKRSHVSDSERVHTSGCARSEGFYKLNGFEKARNRRQWGNFSESEQNGNYSVNLAEKSAAKTQLTISREARSNQRRLLTALGNEVDSDLLKFNQLKFRKKSLRFGRSTIHDWGLFASEPIAADEMVIEYVGQMIRPVIADLRERQYEAVGIGSSYLFRIDLENIIDATRCGNLSRFINHSCNPNCYAKIITIEGIKKIVIYSKQPIGVNEEITYDYKFPIEDDKIACLCGAFQCRGYLN